MFILFFFFFFFFFFFWGGGGGGGGRRAYGNINILLSSSFVISILMVEFSVILMLSETYSRKNHILEPWKFCAPVQVQYSTL